VARETLAMASFGASMLVELSFSHVESMQNFWLPRPFSDMGRRKWCQKKDENVELASKNPAGGPTLPSENRVFLWSRAAADAALHYGEIWKVRKCNTSKL
jgi:hypothetical protein